MRNIQSLTFAIPALLLSVAPLAAQCQMQYNISVYTDGSVSDDLSTVYGSSNFVDNSTLCGATHSNYQSITTIYPPRGSSVTNQESGFESNAQIATNGVLGTYEVAGGDEFYCSVAEEDIENGDGGPEYPLPVPIPASITGTGTDYSDPSCSGDYGFKIDIAYQLLDNSSPPQPYAVSGLQCYEQLTNVVSNGTPLPDTAWSPTCGTTNSSGVFHDAPYGACASAAFTFTGTQAMKFTINGTDYPVRTNSFSFSGTGVGKGTMTNGSDVTISH